MRRTISCLGPRSPTKAHRSAYTQGHCTPARGGRAPTIGHRFALSPPLQSKHDPRMDALHLHCNRRATQPVLSQFHPGIANGWVTASNRLINPNTELPNSRKLVWWRCSSCPKVFQRSIAEHVGCNGACAGCGAKPALNQTYPRLARDLKFRRLTNRLSLWSSNSNRIKLSVVDLGGNGLRMKRPFPSASRRSKQPPPISKRNLMPMLAQTWQKYVPSMSPEDNVYVSPKLDGIRCIAAWDPWSGSVALLSRHGTVINSCPHVNAALAPYFASDPWLVLDGELYHHTAFQTFEELSGLIRRSRVDGPSAEADAQKLQQIQYHVFDVMESNAGGGRCHTPAVDDGARHRKKRPSARTRSPPRKMNIAQLPFDRRHRVLDQLIRTTSSSTSPLRVVPAIPCPVEKVDHYLRLFVSKGFEGVMVRRPAEPYAHGKRSAYLLKYKVLQDDEYQICGVVEGSGKWKRSLAAFLCRTRKGLSFHATPAVSNERRRSLWDERRGLIGKMLTVQFQELTRRGVPRFPVGKSIRGGANRRDWL